MSCKHNWYFVKIMMMLDEILNAIFVCDKCGKIKYVKVHGVRKK